MNAASLITLYTTLFYVSLAICALGLICAVAFYFLFDIRKVYTQVTGRGKEKLMQRNAREKAKAKPKAAVERRRNTANLRSTELYTQGITGGIVQPDEEQSTSVLAAQPQESAPAQMGARSLPGDDATTTTSILGRAAPQPAYRFEIFENEMQIHTEELI